MKPGLEDSRKIEVTDNDTGEVTVYDLSRNNWRDRLACMRGDLVIMWAPPELPLSGLYVITSGRKWRVVK